MNHSAGQAFQPDSRSLVITPGPRQAGKPDLRLWIAVAASLLLASSAFGQQGGGTFQVMLGDGRVVSGVPAELTDQRVVLAGDRRVDVPMADVVRITAAGGRESPPAAGTAVVLLVNGDRLLVERASLRATDVELAARWQRFPAWQPLNVPLETVRGVVLGVPEAREAADRLAAAIREHTEHADLIVLQNEDRLAGEFRALDEESVQLAGAVAAVPRTNVRAIAFNPQLFSLPEPGGLRFLVSLVDGSRLTARNLRLDRHGRLDGQGQLHFEPAFGGALDVPLSRVAAIRVLGGRAEWLGPRPPDEYEFQPYLSTHWELQRNRSAVGGPLRLDGAECPLGLGMHSRAAASYELGGRYGWFQATIGVDDVAGPRGSVIFAVEVDGERVYTSPVLRASDPAVTLEPIDLAGRRKLTLIADYGPWGDVQDYGNWCDAVLVRAGDAENRNR